MATINFNLKDYLGNDIQIGDHIKITFPELIFDDGYSYFKRPECTYEAEIRFLPSFGLHIKLLKVIKIEDEKTPPYALGKKLNFRYTKKNWEKI